MSRKSKVKFVYLTTPLDHIDFYFIIRYWTSNNFIWSFWHIVLEETRCRHIGYSFTIGSKESCICASHSQDSTNQGLCWTSYGSLVSASGLHLPNEPCGALSRGLESVSGLKILPCLNWDPNPVPTSLMTDGLDHCATKAGTSSTDSLD